MALKVLSLTSPADIPIIARIHLAAFLTNKFYHPTVRYVKVVEDFASGPTSADLACTDDGTIIAFAKWHVYTISAAVDTRQDAGSRSWTPNCNVPCVEDFWSKLQAVRYKWGPTLGPHLMLDILATDPAQMRRGAGQMLMQFGTAMADRMGLPCFLEGSPEGRGLYRASGFEVVDWIWLDLARYQDGGEQAG